MNEKQKQLTILFIFLFVTSFVVINWDSVSWMFNYKEVTGLAYDFFNPYQESPLLVSAANAAVDNNQKPVPAVVAAAQVAYPYSDKENSMEIPSIGLVTPLVVGQSTDVNMVEKELDKGVVYYPGSVLPGQNGQMVVLGHSAPPNWPHIKHDWVFSNISQLNIGEKIVMYFNNREYTYLVKAKNIIPKGQDIVSEGTATNNILTIVSCWPPGKNYKRIAIDAQLVKNP